MLWHADRLATLEEVSYSGEMSSLRILCRIDVALIEKNGKLHWFVHEVERGPSVVVFAREAEEHFIILADSFLKAFLVWFKHRSRTLH